MTCTGIYILIIYNSFTFFWWLLCIRWARSIQSKFLEISLQNSMDRFGPTGKVSKKTGPPFEVGHFSRSDQSEFWLNGSRPVSPYKALMSKIAKSYPLFHLDLRGRKLICTINLTLWSVKYCGPERLFATKSLRQLSCFFIFFAKFSCERLTRVN